MIHITTIDQPHVFLSPVGSWFWNQELPQFPGGYYVWVECCLSLNVKPQSQCPKDREQVTHPYVVQHPEKYHCGGNNYSFDALQAYCFGIN